MKPLTAMLFSAILASSSIVPATAQQNAVAGEVIVAVVHIDFRPDSLASVPLLKEYVAHAEHDPNILHIRLLQQLSAPNHYTMIETLKDMDAYKAHVQAPYTLKFRMAVDPVLGAPYDERLHRESSAK